MAACGDDGGSNHPPDAPVGGDAPALDAPATTGSVNVKATVRSNSDSAPGTPQANVLVVALQKDGTLVGTAMTAADGTATLAGVSDGASVTAVYPDDVNGNHMLVTYAGVKIGDTLTFGDKYFTPPVQGTDGSMLVTWQPVTNATSYVIYGQCYESGRYVGNNTSVNLALYESCQSATSPFIVKAYGNDGLLASIHVASTASTPGTMLDLTAGQWVAATASNATIGISGLSAMTNDVELDYFADFHGLRDYNYRYPGIDAGAASETFTIAAADTLTGGAQLYRAGNGVQASYKQSASPIALTAPTLPWIDGLVANSKQVLWLQTSGTTYDAALLQLGWHRDMDDGKGSGSTTTVNWNWNVILPPGGTGFTIPTPPPALAAMLPDDTTRVDSDLVFIDLSSAADYDAVRALPEYRLTNIESAVRNGDEASATTSSSYEGGEGVSFARKVDKVTRLITSRLPHSATQR